MDHLPVTFRPGDAPRRKLTDAQVRQIRRLAATILHGSLVERALDVQHDLRLHHVSVCAIRQVMTGESFANLDASPWRVPDSKELG